jgi:hypothetical protein
MKRSVPNRIYAALAPQETLMLFSRPLRHASLPVLAVLLLSCGKGPALFLDSPVHGTFLNATTVLVEGRMRTPGAFVSLDVNGIAVPPAADWSVTVPLQAADVFNRISAVATLDSGATQRRSVVLVVGDGVSSGFVLDGEPSPESVALRVADTGLDQIAPIVESLSSDALDISSLITAQNPIAQGSMSGINYVANVVEVGFGGFGLDVTTAPTGLDTTVSITDFFLEVDLDLGWLGSCTLEVETTSADITGSYDLEPLASDPSFVDVNLVSAVGVALGGFSSQFVSGICNDPLIGDIVNLIIGQGDIQQLMQDGFEDNLADPDGSGPLDSPLAAGIQTALAGISIAGPVGSALGGVMDAPIVSVVEEVNGLTLAADAAIYSNAPDPEAPDLPASYTVADTFPTFGATTPVGGLPYGLAFALSNSAMNQLLKTQIENGLLRSELTEFLGLPLTAGLMAALIPEFAALPPSDPIVIALAPTLAPVFTGNPGPAGEFAEMKIAGLEVQIVSPSVGQTLIALEVDLDAGLDLAFTPSGLEFTLATPGAGGIDLTVTVNAVNTNEPTLVSTFQQVFPLFAGELEDAIDAFPIPSLLGLDLEPVEVAHLPGGFIGLFANLVQTPTSTIQNVSFTDQSSGDFQQSGGCWLREWRHRLSGNHFGNTVSANMRGMLGADAGCTTNDASSSATMAFRVDFDVVSVPGEQWTIDVDHSILGALDRISDGYNDGIGFQDGGGTATIQTPVQGSYQVVGGASGSFDFTPSVTQISDGIGGGSSDQDVPFSGANGTSLVGTGDATVQLVFSVQLDAHSNSNTAFPTANGDEMAIRLGKNDTIDNNFTAGSYPGMGSRNIADDGHWVSVLLTSVPAP